MTRLSDRRISERLYAGLQDHSCSAQHIRLCRPDLRHRRPWRRRKDLLPDYIHGYEGTDLVMENYSGNTYPIPKIKDRAPGRHVNRNRTAATPIKMRMSSDNGIGDPIYVKSIWLWVSIAKPSRNSTVSKRSMRWKDAVLRDSRSNLSDRSCADLIRRIAEAVGFGVQYSGRS